MFFLSLYSLSYTWMRINNNKGTISFCAMLQGWETGWVWCCVFWSQNITLLNSWIATEFYGMNWIPGIVFVCVCVYTTGEGSKCREAASFLCQVGKARDEKQSKQVLIELRARKMYINEQLYRSVYQHLTVDIQI